MRLMVILSIALLLVVFVEAQGQFCEPGLVYRVDCNTCRCNQYGTNMSCTRRQCSPNGNPRRRPGSGRRRRICEPGSTFKKACNTCRCNNDGTDATCTMYGCI